MSEVSVIFVTAGSEEASAIAKTGGRKAGGLRQYHSSNPLHLFLEREVHDEGEALMIMKTRTSLFSHVKASRRLWVRAPRWAVICER